MEYSPEGKLFETPRNTAILSSENALNFAAETGRILEARVEMCDARHNLVLNLGCMKGFMPRAETMQGLPDDMSRDIAVISRVNKPVCFVIRGFTERDGARTALVSRAAAQRECESNYLSRLNCGDVIPARVTYLESFGAFADVGCGIISMIPIDCISVSRISHSRDRFRVGQEIFAAVRGRDLQGRLCLTHRELLGTWSENASRFCAGQTVSGIVRSVEEYGIFVELAPNLAGLAERKDGVEVGMQAAVFIKSIIPEKMKVKLAIVDSSPDMFKPSELDYYITSGHIDRWRYSPPESNRKIETDFTVPVELGQRM